MMMMMMMMMMMVLEMMGVVSVDDNGDGDGNDDDSYENGDGDGGWTRRKMTTFPLTSVAPRFWSIPHPTSARHFALPSHDVTRVTAKMVCNDAIIDDRLHGSAFKI